MTEKDYILTTNKTVIVSVLNVLNGLHSDYLLKESEKHELFKILHEYRDKLFSEIKTE